MTTLERIETLWPQLMPEERAQLVLHLVPPSRIERTPGVNGGSACIGRTRIAVWMLEAARREGLSDVQILEMYPQLSIHDLEGARRCVAGHEAEIKREVLRMNGRKPQRKRGAVAGDAQI